MHTHTSRALVTGNVTARTCLVRHSLGAARCPRPEPSKRPRTSRDPPPVAMPKALHFKGDKKAKKRRKTAEPYDADEAPSKQLGTAAPATDDDDSWVSADAASDVSGPVVLVLPTDAPMCMACDANGKVFASALENVVDGDSATAEPHDVRQVFIANRVAGTEKLSLKGHHGRYAYLLFHGDGRL